MPLIVTACTAVTWSAIGDPDALRGLLHPINAIDKKRGHGEGTVTGWDVTPVRRPSWEAGHLYADGSLGRPCPADCLPVELQTQLPSLTQTPAPLHAPQPVGSAVPAGVPRRHLVTTSERRPAGLDLDTLRQLRVPRRDPAQLVDRIETHLDRHDGYLAFSGGKDSLAVLHLALQAEPNLPVVFFDSGLEFPETLTYLDQIAALLSVPGGIQIYPAKPTLLELMIADGSWDHLSTNTGRGVDLREVLIT